MATIHVTREYIAEAMRHPDVQKHLGVVARRIADRARSIAVAEEVDLNIWVEETIRPKGRPQAMVWGDNAGQEFGTSRQRRARIFGRAAEEVG